MQGFTAERADDVFTIRDDVTASQDVRFRTSGTFGGFTVDKPNGASGFMSFMPNSETPQIIAGNPTAASGANNFKIDADNQGTLCLNVLPGAGAGAEINATCGAPLRPDVDLTSALGRPDKRWKELWSSGLRYNVTQTAHGLSIPSFGFLPVYWNSTNSQYEPANANDILKAADFLVVDTPDANTLTIQEGGFLYGAHGLNVGQWYALRSGLAGLILPSDMLNGMNKQYLCFVVDSDTLILRVDPIFEDNSFTPEDISVLTDWAQSTTAPDTAGDDRLLIVSVSWEDQEGSTLVSGITIGGQVGTLVTEQSIISGLDQGSTICYWTDAQMEAMTDQNIIITWTSGAPTYHATYHAIIDHVDQVNPIVNTNTDSGTGGTDTMDADVNTTAGGYAMMISSAGNAGVTFTNNGTGWTRKLNLVITSADGVVDDKLTPTAATPENVNMSLSGSNRHVLLGASFRRRES